MKLPTETEEVFLRRVEDARAKGICIFRDDTNREKILDIIEAYIDIRNAANEK